MKKIIFKACVLLFVAMLNTANYINAQEITKFKDDNAVYFKMIENINHDIDNVLVESKPSKMNLSEYKVNLISGKITLAKEYQDKILEITKPLAEYGYELAKMNDINIDADDISAKLTFATLNFRTFGLRIPDITINEKLTWGEVGNCALGALGVNAVTALGAEAASWTMASITSAFTAVAKRFLGPIGVAIAGISFGLCLIAEAQDYSVPQSNDPKDLKNVRVQFDPEKLMFIIPEP